MANKKIVSTMATSIELDGSKATKSLKELKSAITSTGKEFKYLENEAKSSGDELKASDLRVEGLTKQLDLSAKQINETKKQMNELNRGTKSGQEAYSKLSQQLLNAQTKQESLNRQMKSAESYNKALKDGTIELNKSIKNRNDLTKATVERLQAEGKAEEASKVKAKALTDTKKDLVTLLEKESSKLKGIETQTGKSSEAYVKQAVKLEHLKTNLAKTTAEMSEMGVNSEKANAQMSKLSGKSSLFGGLGGKVGGLGGKFKGLADKAGASKMAIAGAVSGITASVALVGSALDKIYDAQSQVSTLQAKTTLSYKKSKSSIEAVNRLYAKGYGESLEDLQEVYGKVAQYNPKASVKELAENTKLVSSYAKLTGQDVDEVLSGAEKATKNYGISFNTYFDNMTALQKRGDDLSGDLSDNMAEYSQKMSQYGFTIKDTMSLIDNGVKSGAYNADKLLDFTKEFGISLNDGRMDSAIGSFSKKSQDMFKGYKEGKVSTSQLFKQITGEMGKMTDKTKEASIASTLWSALGEDNSLKVINSLGKTNNAFNKVGGTAKKTNEQIKESNPFELIKRSAQASISSVKMSSSQTKNFRRALKPLQRTINGLIKTLIKNLPKITRNVNRVMNFVIKHGKTIVGVLGAIVAVGIIGKIVKTVSAVKSLITVVRVLSLAIASNPIGLALTGISLLIVGLVELYKHFKPFRKLVNAIGNNFKKQINRTVKSFKSLVKGASNMWSGVKDAFGDGWSKTKKITNAVVNGVVHRFNVMKNNATKNVKSLWGNAKDIAGSGRKVQIALVGTMADVITGKWGNLKKDVTNIGKSMFGLIKSIAKAGYNTLNIMTGGGLAKVTGGWKGFSKGIKGIFTGLWKTIKKIATGGINGLINIVNSGIKGIDSLIHTFGGKKQTIKPIDKVKFATGTGALGGSRRAINSLTHAILNDGNDSPETGNKEMLIHPNGNMSLVKGRNTEMMLPAGTEVLNAKETKLLMGLQGVQHFATGTGFFGGLFDGIKSITKKVKAFTNVLEHPVKTFNSLFSDKSSGSGVMADITSGLAKSAKSSAKSWFNEMVSMFSDSAGSGGGTSSELLNYAKKEFSGASYVFGSLKKMALDCSGLVKLALGHFGIDVPHQSQAILKDSQLKKIDKSEAKAGDIVGWGAGSSPTGHIGIYEGRGKFFSALSPDTNPNVKTTTVAGMSKLDPFKGYYRVKGLKQDSSSDDVKANGSIQKSVKSLLGGGIFKWITKHIAPLFSSIGGGDSGSRSVSAWKPEVIKALKMNGLSTSPSMINKVLRQIQTESGGDAGAVQHGYTDVNTLTGNLAQGLMQVIPPTFNAYKFKGHGNILNGLDNLLAGLNYAKHRYGKSLSVLGNGHGYSNGGLIDKQQIATLGENNQPEMVIPLSKMKTSRALTLLNQAMGVIHAENGINTADTNSTSVGLDDTKLDTMINLLAQLVQSQSEPVRAYVNSGDIYTANKTETKKRNTANSFAKG